MHLSASYLYIRYINFDIDIDLPTYYCYDLYHGSFAMQTRLPVVTIPPGRLLLTYYLLSVQT